MLQCADEIGYLRDMKRGVRGEVPRSMYGRSVYFTGTWAVNGVHGLRTPCQYNRAREGEGDGRTNQPTNQPEEGAVCTGGIFSAPGPVAGGGETGNLHAEYAQPRDQGGRLVSCDGWDYGRVQGARGLTVNSALGGT